MELNTDIVTAAIILDKDIVDPESIKIEAIPSKAENCTTWDEILLNDIIRKKNKDKKKRSFFGMPILNQ